MAAPPLPADLATLQAPAAWQAIDFISDLHLAEDTPHGVAAWQRYLRETRADAVFILGDLFEIWVGDDARHAGFEAHGAAILADSASRRPTAFMCGNRDFLLGREMLEACGVTALADPTVLCAFGARTLLTHGDALCVADLDYQQFRRQVRSPQWQRDFLAQPLAERRAQARAMREISEQRKATQAPEAWVDVDTDAALAWLRQAGAQTLIHGHTHRPASQTLAPGLVRHVLSDWELDHGAQPRAEVLRWQAGGLTRLAPEQAGRPVR